MSSTSSSRSSATHDGCPGGEDRKKPPHIPMQVYTHIPGEPTDLRHDATHFGYVLNDSESNMASTPDRREYPLYPNTVFALPGAVKIRGEARMRIFSALGQKGILTLTGDIGDWGRQNYIDGCTSTLLISPVMKGDACMNSLYFPEGVEQTQHTHPSIRAGIIAGGEGVCKTPVGDIPLKKGNSFFLPPETWHSFHTEKGKTLSVVAFHPDSDFGPTHEDHPMLNRTHFQFLHMLKSAKKLSKQ
jgi:quercetin dioxygenase-like cupin family protein